MKKRLFLGAVVGALAIILTTACGCTKQTTNSRRMDIPYVVAKNYFFNNEAAIPADPRITTQAAFEKLFGIASFMGKDGEPTPIDFSKQFVIAVVLPETDVQTDIEGGTLTATKNEMTFIYKVSRGEKQSFTTQPMLLIVVDKKHDTGKVVIREE